MSQGFKLRYDQLREGDPTKENSEAADSAGSNENEFYHTPGHARSLCLVWPTGRRVFLNYAYLVSGELTVEGEKNIITLTFSSHLVTLRGYGLETLFTALLDHFPRLLLAVDPRYAASSNPQETLVTDIVVEQKDK